MRRLLWLVWLLPALLLAACGPASAPQAAAPAAGQVANKAATRPEVTVYLSPT